MAYSSNFANSAARKERGYLPPQNDAERFLVRRVEELCAGALRRNTPQYTGFLSDREQALAKAALSHVGCDFARFDGGFEGAERKILCLEPADSWQEQPFGYLHFTVARPDADKLPNHRDFLGSILGLGLDRACLGDILQDAERKNEFYAIATADKCDFIAQELTQVGHCPIQREPCDALPESALRSAVHTPQEATVPSLRADAVLAAMLHTSRGKAADYIAAARVEINHVPLKAASEPVYENDLFTVRGVGRYRLQAIGGKSKKDRLFITFFQYL